MEQQKEFTVADGKAYQVENLAEWKIILRPKVYKELCAWVAAQDKKNKPTNGYGVCRGDQFLDFILNYKG